MQLLLVGGGGHGKSVLDSIPANAYRQIGIVDAPANIGKQILSVPVIGSDEQLADLFAQGYQHSIISLGSIGSIDKRRHFDEMLTQIGFQFVNVIDPSVVISSHATLGVGNFIAKSATINVDVTIGNHTIINSGATIDHDCIIEDFVHIAPGVTLSGGVTISYGSHIGVGSTVIQGVTIGKNCLIGAGSVVVKDIPDNMIAFGNPCKIKLKR